MNDNSHLPRAVSLTLQPISVFSKQAIICMTFSPLSAIAQASTGVGATLGFPKGA